jgi:hypothetical protein
MSYQGANRLSRYVPYTSSKSHSKQSRQLIQMDYTLPLLNIEDTYHNRVIRSNLTRNIAITFDQVQDELVQALVEFIPVADGGM